MIHSLPQFDNITDLNPLDSIECCLILRTNPTQEVNGDLIGAKLWEMYDYDLDYGFYNHVLAELESQDSAMIYVVSREKCLKYSQLFNKMSIKTEIETLQ
jgi:hypothetical protein